MAASPNLVRTRAGPDDGGGRKNLTGLKTSPEKHRVGDCAIIDSLMDRISSQQRSAVMSAVKGKGTRLEQEFCRALLEEGLRAFVQNDKELPGCPDVVFPDERVAVFIDSCFWHGCEDHLRLPATNVAYWTKKIDRNRKRDGIVNGLLRARGWKVVRIWEHQLRQPSSSKSVVRSLRAVLEARKMTGTD